MKTCKFIYILLILVLFSLSCKNEKVKYKITIDDTNHSNLLLSSDSKEIFKMNFSEEGKLASFSVIDDDREFMIIVNFNSNSIDSFAISDLPSKYSNTSTFYSNNNDTLISTLEQFDNFEIKKEVLKEGIVNVTTSKINE